MGFQYEPLFFLGVEMSDGVRIDEMYVRNSGDGGFILGGDGSSKSAVSLAEHWVDTNWGTGRPTLMCAPPKDRPLSRVISIWLVGPPLEGYEKWCGNHLIITWFVDEIPEDPLKSAMIRVNQHGGWAALSRGFDY